ncbi:MAG: autotransporter domain-containing protein [bacterium]|nr:autotransporter domain-containing protein [bacterium]
MKQSSSNAPLGFSRLRPVVVFGLLMLAGVTSVGAQVLTVGNAVVTEGDAGTTRAIFTVNFSGVTPLQVEVDFATVDNTATAGGGDYQATSGTLTFTSPGSQQVVVPVNGDALQEGNETFLIRLSNAVNATIASSDGVGTIIDDDDAPSLSIGDTEVFEGDGTTNANFTVSLSSASGLTVMASFATRDGTATVADSDYQGATGTVSFAPGETQKTIAVAVNGDTRVEPDETFFVDLSAPANAGLDDAVGEGTILNDDQVVVVPTVSIDDVSVLEGDSGTVAATFTVSLTAPSGGGVTVDFATADGTATTTAADYQPASGTLSFGAGQSTATVAVTVNGDTGVEADETFVVNLSSPVNATLADSQGQGTILNDDATVASRIRLVSAPAVLESAGTATVTVERTGGTGTAARVRVTATAGTAGAGEDFVATSRVLEWAAGEAGERTFQVEILDDNLVEDSETIDLSLSSPVGAVLAEPRGLTLTILDEDTPMTLAPVGEAEVTARVNEQIELRVQVARDDGTPVAGATVLWRIVQGTAELLDGERTTSDAEGTAVQRLEIGASTGEVIVTAEVEGTGQSTTFSVTVEGNLAETIDPELDPGDSAVADVLDRSCANATGTFAEMCGYLFALDPTDQAAAIAELTPEEVAAQGTISLGSQRTQIQNLASRLAALRGGATRQSVDQLAFDLRGRGIQVASLSGGWWNPEDRLAEQLGRALDMDDDETGGGTGDAGMDEAEEGGGRLGLFVNGTLSSGDRPTTRAETGFDFETLGLTAGVDYLLSDSLIVGGALGYLDTDTDLVADGGGLDAEGYSLSAYGTYYREKLYLDGFLSWGSNDYDLVRNVDLPQSFGGQQRFVARGSPGGEQLSLGLGGGYDGNFGASTFGGFARLSYTEADIDGYTEQGAGPFDLVVGEQSLESVLAEAGIEWTYAASRSWGILQPALRLSWLHELEDDLRLIRGRFAEDQTAAEFLVPTESPDRDFFNLSAGLTATLARGRTLYLLYDTDFDRDDLDVYTVTAGFRLEL